MTIRFNQRWNGFDDNSIASLDQNLENKLISEGIAQKYHVPFKIAITVAASWLLSSDSVLGAGITEANKLYVQALALNSNTLKIGFGSSSAAAITAAGTGTVLKGFEQLTIPIPAGSTYFGYVAVGGDVDFNYLATGF